MYAFILDFKEMLKIEIGFILESIFFLKITLFTS